LLQLIWGMGIFCARLIHLCVILSAI